MCEPCVVLKCRYIVLYSLFVCLCEVVEGEEDSLLGE